MTPERALAPNYYLVRDFQLAQFSTLSPLIRSRTQKSDSVLKKQLFSFTTEIFYLDLVLGR